MPGGDGKEGGGVEDTLGVKMNVLHNCTILKGAIGSEHEILEICSPWVRLSWSDTSNRRLLGYNTPKEGGVRDRVGRQRKMSPYNERTLVAVCSACAGGHMC